MIEVDPSVPCPCGRGKLAGACCLKQMRAVEKDVYGQVVSDRVRRVLEMPQADPRPPRPRTGFSHAKCYAGSLNDCSPDIEGEHYFSAGILRFLAGPSGLLSIGGLPRKGAEKKQVYINDLVGNILCARHNRALSPIDKAAIRAFEFIFSHGDYLEAGENRIVGVNGHDIERWLLKALCGVLRVRRDAVPDLWARILFGDGDFLQPRGLYQYVATGDTMSGDTLLLEIAREDDGEPIGCSVRLMNLELVLGMTMATPAREEHVGKLRFYRPGGLRLTYRANGASAALVFSWQGAASRSTIDVDWSPKPTAPPLAGPP